jgi:peptide/nickel transport system substrate-binding protein
MWLFVEFGGSMTDGIARRGLLKGLAGGLGVGLAARINPDFLISSAYAQAGKPIVFLSAENITGNWDPTAHTTLSQKNIEGFVMGFLARAPMRPEDPGRTNMELATDIKLIDTHTLHITLREGVHFHDGTPFTAADVKATFEYGARPDRPAQWYPGPTDSFTVTTPAPLSSIRARAAIPPTSSGSWPNTFPLCRPRMLPPARPGRCRNA